MSNKEKRKTGKPPLFKWRKTPSGVSFRTIACADGKYHPYMNEDVKDLEASPPSQKQPCCTRCGLSCQSGLRDYAAYAEMRTMGIGPLCPECLWDDIAVNAEALSEESGQVFMPAAPRHVQLGAPKHHDWPNN